MFAYWRIKASGTFDEQAVITLNPVQACLCYLVQRDDLVFQACGVIRCECGVESKRRDNFQAFGLS